MAHLKDLIRARHSILVIGHDCPREPAASTALLGQALSRVGLTAIEQGPAG
jgi:hypothetical protein